MKGACICVISLKPQKDDNLSTIPTRSAIGRSFCSQKERGLASSWPPFWTRFRLIDGCAESCSCRARLKPFAFVAAGPGFAERQPDSPGRVCAGAPGLRPGAGGPRAARVRRRCLPPARAGAGPPWRWHPGGQTPRPARGRPGALHPT